jgi:hypothetical protein
MAIYETYSKRQKKLSKQGETDPYRYDIFPRPLRVQLINLLTGILGDYDDSDGDRHPVSARRWEIIHDTLAHEYGEFELAQGEDAQGQCVAFFMGTNQVEECLDFCEIGFRMIEQLAEVFLGHEKAECGRAIEELNHRFREHGVGYQFEMGEIIRVDSQYIHAEVVKPAIGLLHDANFSGASEEFLQAHEHYRAKRYPEAIAGALKAFESTMKGICDVRKWDYQAGTTAKGLIEIIFSKELIPASLASQFSGLRSVLESGLPTVRNQQGGHGQGKDSVEIPSYMAAYALHLAASNIVMLLEAHKALK